METLYSLSPTLQVRINQVRERVEDLFRREVALVAYIALPEVGQHVILRFALRRKVSTLDELDNIENALARLVGEEFWAVLVGETYHRVIPEGSLAALPASLEKLARDLADLPVPVASTPHAPEIRKDAQRIRRHLSLGARDWVWEVEVPWAGGGLPVLRIVTEEPRGPQEITLGGRRISVVEVPPGDDYVGLVKAYPQARRAGRALVRYILEHTGER